MKRENKSKLFKQCLLADKTVVGEISLLRSPSAKHINCAAVLSDCAVIGQTISVAGRAHAQIYRRKEKKLWCG